MEGSYPNPDVLYHNTNRTVNHIVQYTVIIILIIYTQGPFTSNYSNKVHAMSTETTLSTDEAWEMRLKAPEKRQLLELGFANFFVQLLFLRSSIHLYNALEKNYNIN